VFRRRSSSVRVVDFTVCRTPLMAYKTRVCVCVCVERCSGACRISSTCGFDRQRGGGSDGVYCCVRMCGFGCVRCVCVRLCPPARSSNTIRAVVPWLRTGPRVLPPPTHTLLSWMSLHFSWISFASIGTFVLSVRDFTEILGLGERARIKLPASLNTAAAGAGAGLRAGQDTCSPACRHVCVSAWHTQYAWHAHGTHVCMVRMRECWHMQYVCCMAPTSSQPARASRLHRRRSLAPVHAWGSGGARSC
jgi:hypothetical protein